MLVLDEPTAHLDADTARLVAAEILDEERGRSIVWITHGTIGLDAMDQVVRLGETRPSGARRLSGRVRLHAAIAHH